MCDAFTGNSSAAASVISCDSSHIMLLWLWQSHGHNCFSVKDSFVHVEKGGIHFSWQQQITNHPPIFLIVFPDWVVEVLIPVQLKVDRRHTDCHRASTETPIRINFTLYFGLWKETWKLEMKLIAQGGHAKCTQTGSRQVQSQNLRAVTRLQWTPHRGIVWIMNISSLSLSVLITVKKSSFLFYMHFIFWSFISTFSVQLGD